MLEGALFLNTLVPAVIVGFLVFFGVNIARLAKRGMVFSDRVWKWHEGQTLKLTDLWSSLGSLNLFFINTKLPAVLPQIVAEGNQGGVAFKVYRIGFDVQGAPRILQVRLAFPQSFSGRMVVYRVNGPTLGPDAELESVVFNKQTYVFASAPKVPYAIFSPDFMEWYLARSEKPFLIFEGTTCYCTVVETTPLRDEDIKNLIGGLLHHIRHSGALGS